MNANYLRIANIRLFIYPTPALPVPAFSLRISSSTGEGSIFFYNYLILIFPLHTCREWLRGWAME